MKHLFSLILAFFLFVPLWAQEFEGDIDTSEYYWVDEFTHPKYSLGVTLNSIISPWPAIQFSHDFRITDKWNLAVETGFIFTSGYNGRGFKIRPTMEYMFWKDDIFGFFIGAGINSSNIWEQFQYTVRFEDAYWRDFVVFRNRNQVALYGSLGTKINLYKESFLELSLGLGPSRLYNSNIPVDIFNRNNPFSILPIQNGWHTTLVLYGNLNISVPIVR